MVTDGKSQGWASTTYIGNDEFLTLGHKNASHHVENNL